MLRAIQHPLQSVVCIQWCQHFALRGFKFQVHHHVLSSHQE